MNKVSSAWEKAFAGAEFLDSVRPGWEREIDHDVLNIGDPSCCMLGQLYASFKKGLKKLDLNNEDAVEMGFLAPAELNYNRGDEVSEMEVRIVNKQYEELTAAWREIQRDWNPLPAVS